jgi:hypothetical protein
VNPVVFKWLEVEVTDPGDGTVEKALAMVPAARYRNVAKRQYGATGSEHTLGPISKRDRRSHNHFFAALGNLFDNIPERMQARWPTDEHFRKWLLIETGWFTEKEWSFEGRDAEKQAKRLAAFFRSEDEYLRCWVTSVEQGENDFDGMIDVAVEKWTEVGDAVLLRDRMTSALRAAWRFLDSSTAKKAKWKVLVRKAVSQSEAEMVPEDFKKSKRDVLELAEHLVAVPRGSGMKHAGRSA